MVDLRTVEDIYSPMRKTGKKFSNVSIIRCAIVVLIIGFIKEPLSAQTNLPQGDPIETIYRLHQIHGINSATYSFLLRPVLAISEIEADGKSGHFNFYRYTPEGYGYSVAGSGSHIKIQLFEPVWFQSYNTALPGGGMDGAIWQGRGYNSSFSTGFHLKSGPLHLTLRPVFGFAQNRSFDMGPYDPPQIRTNYYRGTAGEYAYRGFRGIIDQPIRFGPDSYSWFDLGDSSLEVRFQGFSAALSNQRLWTGPGIHNSLQFGYNAPGFMHFRLGTYRPVETRIGSFEGMYIFGGVRKSDYLDENVYDRHSVNTLALVYSPRFAPGLSVGAVRTFFHRYPADFAEFRNQATKLFEAAVRVGLQDEENPTGYDPDNQIGSVFARWFFPESGFEFYFEYGRNDHNVDLRDFRAHPNHHRAYLLGLQKSMKFSNSTFLSAGLELMQTETTRSSLLRGNEYLGGWYTHGQQVVGFTNRGQIMGTAFGPGTNVQMIFSDLYTPKGRYGITFSRIVYHNSRVDQYFSQIQRVNEQSVERWQVRNVEFMAGLKASFLVLYGLEIDAAIEHSFIFNHHNLMGNDLSNTRFELTLRKRIEGWLR